MLSIITPENRDDNKILLQDVFRLRKKVFADQLKWEVPVKGDLEFDLYDDLDCVYLATQCPTTGRVSGALRLMPTTGPHLMRDVFAHWFDDPIVLESSTIWEVTRFCIDPDFQKGPYSPRGLNLVSSQLLVGLAEISLRAGLTQVTGLCHRAMINVLKRTRWAPEIIAVSKVPQTGPVYLGLWDVNADVVTTLKTASGLGSQIGPQTDLSVAPLAA
ncbi:MAG: acyl-homoserine-lactone synthase [Beijerinckiaceae bacterium]